MVDGRVINVNLHLYDSATQSLRPLVPLRQGHVGIYLCGATVQGSPHIGHVRSAIAFDTLIRWLTRQGIEVTYVRNITDIDDKILRKSSENRKQWWAWAARFEREFARAYDALGLIPPTFEPRATAHITDQIELIQRLMDRGHAYADGCGNVYFSVTSFPDYGQLTHQHIDNMRTTEDESQVDALVEAGKRDPRDFALWKAAKKEEPSTAAWDSPWGRGRPGWHLECSAMAHRYLGEAFDIHGGGIDLRFPHHENEQAQSRAAGWGFTQLWVHNAWVTLKGEKMSKSLGNSLVVADLLKEVPAPVLRFALGTVHHRSTVEFSDDTLTQAQSSWARLTQFAQRATTFLATAGADPIEDSDVETHPIPQDFARALDDDLNVAAGMAVVHAAVRAGYHAIENGDVEQARHHLLDMRAMMSILGLDPLSSQWRDEAHNMRGSEGRALATVVEYLLEERGAARAERDWVRADAIRDILSSAGIVVEDRPGAASWHLQ